MFYYSNILYTSLLALSVSMGSVSATITDGEETGASGSNVSHAPFGKLNPNIALEIFKYLPQKDLLCASEVCKDWNANSKQQELWQNNSDKREVWNNFATNLGFQPNQNMTPKKFMSIVLSPEIIEKVISSAKLDVINQLADAGVEEAIKAKMSEIERTRSAEELKDFIDANAIRSEHVFRSKLYGLQTGYYGYSKSPDEARKLIEAGVEAGNLKAVMEKVYALENELLGYTKNAQEVRNLIDFAAKQGVPSAVEKKFSGLMFGDYGYTQDPDKAKQLVESFAQSGNSKALALVISSHGNDIKFIVNALAQAGNPEALKRILNDIESKHTNFTSLDSNGFPMAEDPSLAHAAKKAGTKADIEEQVIANPSIGNNVKLYALLNGAGDYFGDNHSSFIDTLVQAGNPLAVELKIDGLRNGKYGYTNDPLALRSFIEQQTAQGNPIAITEKINGLINGKNGYTKDPDLLNTYIQLIKDF